MNIFSKKYLAFLVYEPHRQIEFEAIADKLKEQPCWRLMRNCLNNIDMFGIFNLVKQSTDLDTLIVHAETPGKELGEPVKHPVMLCPVGEKFPFMTGCSALDILDEHDIVLSPIISTITASAANANKTIIIIPGRSDSDEDPSYIPPKCWFDLLTDSDIYYYSGGC